LQALQRIVGRHLIVSVPNEPLWSVLNLARGKYVTHWGNTPGHIQRWSKDGFIRVITKYFDVIEVRSPLPWTMLLCQPGVETLAMHPMLKCGLHWSGSALAIAGIAFVALRLRDYGTEIDFARFGMVEWSEIVIFTLIYGLANLMLAYAWLNLLKKFGAPVSNRWAIKAYGVSQLAKYVPGNIFHLAGRQTIGMAAGVPGWPLAKSSIWELGLLTLAGALFGVLAFPLTVSDVSVPFVTLLFVITAIAVVALLVRYFGQPIARHLHGTYFFLQSPPLYLSA